jgi:hypothetical protein
MAFSASRSVSFPALNCAISHRLRRSSHRRSRWSIRIGPRRPGCSRLRAPLDERRERIALFLVLLLGALLSRDLGRLLATVVLAGIIRATLALEVDSKFRLTRSC